jgi:hypothetical protein
MRNATCPICGRPTVNPCCPLVYGIVWFCQEHLDLAWELREIQQGGGCNE